MRQVLHISAYKFVPLTDTTALRATLVARAQHLGLLGTILLAPEGINLFLSGPATAVQTFLSQLQQDPRLSDLTARQSWSARQPFRKLRVRLKREIIRMNHPTVRPAEGRAPAVSATTLKQWLDAGVDDDGRPVVLLDTRNGFEVDEGSFAGAIDWRLARFSDFPQALMAHRAELQDRTVVSFCTGGIRCEKAALFMREQGLTHSYQLDGGILAYFEATGGAHFRGRCFVFDERHSLDTQLDPLAAEPAAAGPASGFSR